MTRAAVYRLYDANDRLLYVGATTNPPRRFTQHHKREWWPQVARYDIEWLDDVATAFDAESKAIHKEKPLHNVALPSTYDPSKATWIMGAQEVGKMLGVNRQRVTQLAATPDFPKPQQVIAAGSIWLGEDVIAWAESHRRMAIETD